MTRASRTIGLLLLASLVILAAAGPRLVSHGPAEQFPDFVFAPPMRPHVIDAEGRWRAPFVYPIRLVNRLERTYAEERTRRLPLRWFRRGVVVSIDEGRWFPLGTDALGRDLAARLCEERAVVAGAEVSVPAAEVHDAPAARQRGAGGEELVDGHQLETFLGALPVRQAVHNDRIARH